MGLPVYLGAGLGQWIGSDFVGFICSIWSNKYSYYFTLEAYIEGFPHLILFNLLLILYITIFMQDFALIY